jgi:CBS domain-containing protein
LGFFKHFILEKSGEHKDEFDLKLRAMMPIADVARLLALKSQTVYPSNTIERLERVAETVSIGKEVVEDAAAAYEIFLRARARSGFSQKTSGRYLNLNELTNFEKQVLKNAFDPLREIQHLIKPA